jgi:hypothetical protein
LEYESPSWIKWHAHCRWQSIGTNAMCQLGKNEGHPSSRMKSGVVYRSTLSQGGGGLKAAARLGPLEFRAWLLRRLRYPPLSRPADQAVFALTEADMVALRRRAYPARRISETDVAQKKKPPAGGLSIRS